MKTSLEILVWERAHQRCEYCLVPQTADDLPFHIDHIVARQHEGPSVASNLALACYACNLHKGPNLAGRDPKTKRTVRLFNPRRHLWHRHFEWKGAVVLGLSAVGRATIATLKMNRSHRVELREALMDQGVYPPGEEE